MALSVIYGSKNVIYNLSVGKITWGNPLAVLSKGGIHTPNSTDVLIRDDLGGGSEAMNDEGVPLPLDKCIVYKITSVADNLAGEYHIHNIYDTGIVEDDSNIILFANVGGLVCYRSGDIYNPLEAAEASAKSYTDSSVRTDQEIIDVVTAHGISVNDYGVATAERIKIIIDKTMQNDAINDAKNDLIQSFNDMGLPGDVKAKMESEFMTELTRTVITTAMQVGSSSMLTQKQGELAQRQKEGFNDNLLVKANDSLGGVLGLTNSGTGNTVGTVVSSYSSTISDLITRSKRN